MREKRTWLERRARQGSLFSRMWRRISRGLCAAMDMIAWRTASPCCRRPSQSSLEKTVPSWCMPLTKAWSSVSIP
eukprot:931048-Rhodomonas_salina.1